MQHKNDYSCIVYFPNDEPKKWAYVHSLYNFSKFLDIKHPSWSYFNVYERRTTGYLKRFYKGNIVPIFLSLLIFLIGTVFFLTFNNTATIPTCHHSKEGLL